jgi:hypothetical protein
MKNKVIWFTALCFILILNSCKNGPVEPDDSNATPGRRDYVWTADTIKAYYIYFNSIWGKTANDVWAVSSVGSVFENIYRYDGTKWYRETRTPISGTVSIFGIDNNLWICCKDGRIWNYKDNIFYSSPQFTYEDKEIVFFSMTGKSETELYAGGGKSIPYNKDAILFKYDGNQWQMIKAIKNYGNIYWIKYCSENDRYYFLTYLDNEKIADTTRLIEYNGMDLKTIIEQPSGNNLIINDIAGFLYISIGNKIYRYYNDCMTNILEVTESKLLGQIWGRSRNDLFIQMLDGLIHYNGSDVQYILKFPENTVFGSCALVLDKDIFLHAFDNKTGYSIIYHGKLKE